MSGTHFSGPIRLGPESVLLSTDVGGLAGAKTLTADESNGTHYILDGGTGFGITLPVVTQGWNCKFTIGAIFGTNFVFTAGSADTLEGCLILAGAAVTVNAADAITLDATKENIGDYIEFYSDGTSTFAYGNFLTSAAATSAG